MLVLKTDVVFYIAIDKLEKQFSSNASKTVSMFTLI